MESALCVYITKGWRRGRGQYWTTENTDENFPSEVWVYKLLSCIQFFVTSRTVAHQAPLSVEFSRHEYWSGEPFPSPGHINLGDPQEQSCQTMELVTVSHLLVGLDIVQFPVSMNSNFGPCLELIRYFTLLVPWNLRDQKQARKNFYNDETCP